MKNSINEIRQIFFNFFHEKGHKILESSSLIPDNNSSLLLTNSGMNQFKDIFLNPNDYIHKRVVTSQRCIRAGGKYNDLENVGHTTHHHTFFEMLGNFSFGDYFKYDAIHFAWELLTDKNWFSLPKERLWITVYKDDYESYLIWTEKIGIPRNRIVRVGGNNIDKYESDNFWKIDDIGLCGPCSEIFYDRGSNINENLFNQRKKLENRYIEIWNLVFLQFNRQINGELLPISNPSIDTGMGLERIASVLQNVDSNYSIDIFKDLIKSIVNTVHIKNFQNKSIFIIADHIRSCVFLIKDGVLPSNEGRGYILRKIIRRSIRHGKILGIKEIFLYKLVSPLISIMNNYSKFLLPKKEEIERILYLEEEKFHVVLKRGTKLLKKEIKKVSGNFLSGKSAFTLYDTYGLPIDLTIDICKDHQLQVDIKSFNNIIRIQHNKLKEKNKISFYENQLSYGKKTIFLGYERLKNEGKILLLLKENSEVKSIFKNEKSVIILNKTSFYGESGGQIGDTGYIKSHSGIFQVTNTKKYGNVFFHIGIVKHGKLEINTEVITIVNENRRKKICANHSSTHLLYFALRKIFGDTIEQRGSLIKSDYLRFDFFYTEKILPEQILLIENIVNKKIIDNVMVNTEKFLSQEINKNKIKNLFQKKYEKEIRIVSIGNFSCDPCIGTHVKQTGEIGTFKIISISKIGSGIYRIIAKSGKKAIEFTQTQNILLQKIKNLVKSNMDQLIDNIQSLKNNIIILKKYIKSMNNKKIYDQERALLTGKFLEINGIKIMVEKLKYFRKKILDNIFKKLEKKLKTYIIVLILIEKNSVNLIINISKNLINFIEKEEILKFFLKKINGKVVHQKMNNFYIRLENNVEITLNILEYVNTFLEKKCQTYKNIN